MGLGLASTQQAVQADKIQLAELVPRHNSQRILPLNRALYALKGLCMNQNLYFQTNKFDSSKELADYVYSELTKLSLDSSEPVDSGYMFSIEANVDGIFVDIFMGKNDEKTQIPLWQIWPEQRVPFLKKLFGKADRTAELKVKSKLEKIVKSINGVSAVEWGI